MKILFLLSMLTFSMNLWSYTKGKVYKITILHTNDHHGRFWSNSDGELGLAARATLIKELREQVAKDGGYSLLLDAGDVNTGIPQSDLQEAEPDFKGMGLIGYDVMALGNHEFDHGLETIFKQRKWAGFPFVSANIYHKNGQRVFPSHIDRTFGDLRISVFGLTTEDTPLKTKPAHTGDLVFRPAYKEAMELVPKLKPHTDVLIGLTHVGHHPNESHGNDAPGDVTIARSVKGIDLIVGGHTQKPLFEADVQNGTIIVQAFEWGKYVGKVDLEFKDGILNLKEYKLIPVNFGDKKEKILPDRRLLAMLQIYKEIGDTLINEHNKSSDPSAKKVLGRAMVEFQGHRSVIRFQETNLGNLISSAFKERFKADIGIMNSGGVRDSLKAGPIRYEDILVVLPFKGEIVTAELSGKDMETYLQKVIFLSTKGSGSFPQISGVTAELDIENKQFKSLKINGKPLSYDKRYTIALPEFVAKGGDKYPLLEYVKTGLLDAEILRDQILKLKTLRAADYAPKGYLN